MKNNIFGIFTFFAFLFATTLAHAATFEGCPEVYPDGSPALDITKQELRYPDGSFASSNYGSLYANGHTLTVRGQWFYSDGKNLSSNGILLPDGQSLSHPTQLTYKNINYNFLSFDDFTVSFEVPAARYSVEYMFDNHYNVTCRVK